MAPSRNGTKTLKVVSWVMPPYLFSSNKDLTENVNRNTEIDLA